MSAKRNDGNGVQAVERALDVLEVLASSDAAKGVSQLGQATGLPHATVHRLLATLTARSYARQEPESRKYVLGSRLVRLGARSGRFLGTWAKPYLTELADISKETANLAALEDGHVEYLAQVQSRYKVRMFTEVGNRLLPHTTAVGKVLLAALPWPQVERIIAGNGLPAHTPNSITEAERFRRQLEEVAAAGFAVDDEEEELGVRCLAVPVRGPVDVEAAISVSGPSGRLDSSRWRRLVPQMQRVATAMSVDLFGAPADAAGARGDGAGARGDGVAPA